MPGSLLRVALLILGLNVGFVCAARAQYKISIDSVEKFTFLSSTPWWNKTAYYKYEIVPHQQGKWAMYKLEEHSQKGGPELNDTVRKYVRDFAKKDLVLLLKLLAKRDTGINPALFHIKKESLLEAFDTLLPYIGPRERAVIAKWISSRKFLDSMAIDAIRRVDMDDRKYYGIVIKIKGGGSYTISARAVSDTYAHLPWSIGNIKSYDPRIATIFDSVVKEGFNSRSLIRLYEQMAFWAFLNSFQTRLAENILMVDHPMAYRSLTSIFKIETLRDNNRIHQKDRRPDDSLYFSGTFQVKWMSDRIGLYFGFKATDTDTIQSKKRYADTVRHLIDKVYIFGQVRANANAKVVLDHSFMVYNGEQLFRSIAKVFPEIKRYDHKGAQLIKITGDNNVRSVWILLPNNTLILCKYLYKGKLPDLKNTHFMNLPDDLIEKYYGRSGSVCIHLNASGKLIKDYGELPSLGQLQSL